MTQITADRPSVPAVPESLLEVRDLRTYLYTRAGVVKAVDGVTFTVGRGETLGVVGESGSGKSMTALSIMRLVPSPAAKIVSGEILYEGRDLLKLSDDEMRRVRGRSIAMILQDPMTSLNPLLTIGDQLDETVKMADPTVPKAARRNRAIELLSTVRIPSPEKRLKAYPHELSGGMRQRVAGAIALAGEPNVLIADEATTSLDPTIQLQYLMMLKDLQAETGLSIVFITHDFGIVANMCDRVAVMYAGKVVESAPVLDLFEASAHPYTEALMRSVPNVDEDVQQLYAIEGQPPAPNQLPPGCAFAPRCAYVMSKCVAEYPITFSARPGQSAACWRLE